MASYIYQPTSTPDTKRGECDACACHVCGGLECLCRPRFFAGQLLTDETLNRLEHYIVEKNKLHNRYLHGWGVVCGLEVVCNPCNAVIVRPGYALSPCGEDIIVCRDVSVNICDLINQCKDKRRDWDCQPYGMGQNPDCRNVEEEWVLAVRYDETGSRGITALKGGGAPSRTSGCGCGGSSGCGCGCQGQSGNGGSKTSAYATASTGLSVKQNYRQASPTIAAQCEPTLTCEGYAFEVYKKPSETTGVGAHTGRSGLTTGKYALAQGQYGALVDRATKCIFDYIETLPQEPAAQAPRAAWYQYCCSLKERLQNDLYEHPVYECQLSQVLANISCPDPNDKDRFPEDADGDAAYRAAVKDSVNKNLSEVGAEYLQYCICSSLLPPCPEVDCEVRVPLATVTVRKDDNGICRIVRVCNLGQRKYVTTFVSLGYWFSFLQPLWKFLRKILELLCCKPFKFSRRLQGSVAGPNRVPPNPTPEAPAAGEGQPASAAQPVNARNPTGSTSIPAETGINAFVARVWANRKRKRPIDTQTLFLGAIGAKDDNDTPYLAEVEMRNPFYTVMVNTIAGPPLARLPNDTPQKLRRAWTVLFGTGAHDFNAGRSTTGTSEATERASQPSVDEELGDLNARVSELQETVKRQSEVINELRERLNNEQ